MANASSAAMAASLPRRGDMVVGNLDDHGRMRHGVEPAVDAAQMLSR